MNDAPTDATQEEIEIAEFIVSKILDLFGLSGNIEIRRREEGTILDVQGCSNPGRLIGEEGSILYAIQVLVTLIVCRKTQNPTSIVIDVNGYRVRRRRQLEDMAWKAFDKVQRTGRSAALQPMNASDRRIIHMTLSKCEDIETYSVDENPETGTKCVQISLQHGEPIDDEEYFEDEQHPEEEYPEDEGWEQPVS